MTQNSKKYQNTARNACRDLADRINTVLDKEVWLTIKPEGWLTKEQILKIQKESIGKFQR